MTILFSTRMEGDKYALFDKVQQDRPYSEIRMVTIDGKYWLRASILDPTYASDPSSNDRCRAEVTRQRDMNGIYFNETHTHLFYGLTIFVKQDFTCTTGTGSIPNNCCLMQLKEGKAWGIAVHYDLSRDAMRVANRGKPSQYNLPFLRGEPMNPVFEVDSVETGVLRIWLNKVLLIEDFNDYRLGETDASLGRISRYLKFGLYTGINQNSKEAYFTNAIIATTLGEVNEFLYGIEPPPPEPETHPFLQAIIDFLEGLANDIQELLKKLGAI